MTKTDSRLLNRRCAPLTSINWCVKSFLAFHRLKSTVYNNFTVLPHRWECLWSVKPSFLPSKYHDNEVQYCRESFFFVLVFEDFQLRWNQGCDIWLEKQAKSPGKFSMLRECLGKKHWVTIWNVNNINVAITYHVFATSIMSLNVTHRVVSRKSQEL